MTMMTIEIPTTVIIVATIVIYSAACVAIWRRCVNVLAQTTAKNAENQSKHKTHNSNYNRCIEMDKNVAEVWRRAKKGAVAYHPTLGFEDRERFPGPYVFRKQIPQTMGALEQYVSIVRQYLVHDYFLIVDMSPNDKWEVSVGRK